MKGRMPIRSLVFLLVFGFLLLPWSALAGQAKNIILLIGDGMGPSQFGAAWLYSNRILGKELRMVDLMKDGRTAYLVNDTADAIVTESAAAATQIACGVKVPARAAGMGTDGKTPCTTILEIGQGGRQGHGVGDDLGHYGRDPCLVRGACPAPIRRGVGGGAGAQPRGGCIDGRPEAVLPARNVYRW